MRSPRFQRIARFSVVVAAFSMIGCFSYKPVGVLQATDRIPSDVRVFRYNGTVIDFATARIANDTIYGRVARGVVPETKIPLAHVDSMHYRAIEPRKTVMFTVAAIGLLVFSMNYIWANSPGPPM